MKNAAIGIAAIAAPIGTPALAADMAVRAQPPALSPVPAPVYTWTSCYIGANGGYGWNTGNSAYQDPNTTPDPINPPPGDSQILTPTNTNSDGWIGGGEVGCNWQMDSRVVLGLEADIDAAHISGNASTVVGPPADFRVGSGEDDGGSAYYGTASEQVLLRWLSTIRARVDIAKHFLASPISVGLRKIILATFQFFAFSPSLGH